MGLSDSSPSLYSPADLGSLAGGVLDAPFSLGALSLDFSLGTKSGSNFGGSLSMATRGKALSSVLSSAHTLWVRTVVQRVRKIGKIFWVFLVFSLP